METVAFALRIVARSSPTRYRLIPAEMPLAALFNSVPPEDRAEFA